MFFLLREETGWSRFTSPTSHRRPHRAICSTLSPPTTLASFPCTSYPALARTSLSRTRPARRSRSTRRRVLGPAFGRRWMRDITPAANIRTAARNGSGCTRRASASARRHSDPSPRFPPRRCAHRCIRASAWTTRRVRALGAALCSYWRARRAREAFLLELRGRNPVNARGRLARPRAAARVAACVAR